MKRVGRIISFVLFAAAVSGFASQTYARVKLVTLPVRERVEIRLDNRNATLVEEERIVPLVKGVNQVDFSWANTRIDPQTIVFRILPGGESQETVEQVEVLSVSYPPNESALVWQVAAGKSGSARVRISYLIDNLTSSFNYRVVASADEKTMLISQFVRLKNLSNEAFNMTGLSVGVGPALTKPIGINETKQILVGKYQDIPVVKTYTCNVSKYGYIDNGEKKVLIPMHYSLVNDKEHGLGKTSLENGKVRIFQEDSSGSTAFLGEDWGDFTAVDDQMKLYVGVSKDVVVRREIESNERKRIVGNLFEQKIVIRYEIENFKDQQVVLDFVEDIQVLRNEILGSHGSQQRAVQWELGEKTTFSQEIDRILGDHKTIVIHEKLPAANNGGKAKKIVHKLEIILKNEW